MEVIFKAENHQYESTDLVNKIDWISVTHFVSHFKQPFDAKSVSEKASKNQRSKWYGLTPEIIQAAWKAESERAMSMGTWYHDQREKDITEFDTIERGGLIVPIVRPIIIENVKHAPEQKLKDGVYPEHFLYLKSAGLCGQSDRVEVVNGIVSIHDYKTNKEIRMEGFKNWEGLVQKLSSPLNHLDDCHLVHYALQLSLYLYIILKHNPKLKPGKLTLDHVVFEENARDKYDNPVYKINDVGEFIVKDVKHYEIPYYKTEVISMINYLNENRESVKTKNK
jgi:hypothetical protein